MRSLWYLSILLLLSPTGVTYGQNSPGTRASLADIPGVSIHVEPVTKEMEEKGMTDFVFSVEIERHLKDAGVTVLNPEFDDPVPGSPVLAVAVTTVIDEYIEHCAYAIRLELTQTIQLERNPESIIEHVPTWSVGGVGVHGKGWREAIIDEVGGYTDEFIDAYFAANPALNK
jgi:hypothetical protein